MYTAKQVMWVYNIKKSGMSLPSLIQLYNEIEIEDPIIKTPNNDYPEPSNHSSNNINSNDEEEGPLFIKCERGDQQHYDVNLQNRSYEYNGRYHDGCSLTPPDSVGASSLLAEQSMFTPRSPERTDGVNIDMTPVKMEIVPNQRQYVTSDNLQLITEGRGSQSLLGLHALKQMSEDEICDEITKFVDKHRFSQTYIASVSGLTQSCVSKYFKGAKDLVTPDVKERIYRWYIETKRNPQKARSRRSENGDGKAIRKDRYRFRQVHLNILERAFEQNQYPELDTKQELARQCNEELAAIKGRALTESEILTVPILSNWFNNRRKSVSQGKNARIKETDKYIFEETLNHI